jgi:transcription elongation GreA/GreB family factor
MDAEADEIETIQLGSRQSKDNTGTTAQVVSPNTPLGMAILNKKAGETVYFRGPSGDMIGVKIIFVR